MSFVSLRPQCIEGLGETKLTVSRGASHEVLNLALLGLFYPGPRRVRGGRVGLDGAYPLYNPDIQSY